VTDEDRQKLLHDLGYAAGRRDKHGYYGPLCGKALTEIERLSHIVREARKLLGENFEKLEDRVAQLERKAPW
jgi:hypothetical protein